MWPAIADPRNQAPVKVNSDFVLNSVVAGDGWINGQNVPVPRQPVGHSDSYWCASLRNYDPTQMARCRIPYWVIAPQRCRRELRVKLVGILDCLEQMIIDRGSEDRIWAGDGKRDASSSKPANRREP